MRHAEGAPEQEEEGEVDVRADTSAEEGGEGLQGDVGGGELFPLVALVWVWVWLIMGGVLGLRGDREKGRGKRGTYEGE